MKKEKVNNFERRLDECIENIERLGADARFEKNTENYEKLKVKLESLEWWARKAHRLIDKKEMEEEQWKEY